MSIPLYIFYFIYLGLVAIFLLFTLFNIYHLIKFGYLSLNNIIIISFYIIVTILILLISWRYISQINWQENLELMPAINSNIYL